MEANSEMVDKNKQEVEKDKPPVVREKWANKIDFLLACIGKCNLLQLPRARVDMGPTLTICDQHTGWSRVRTLVKC